VRRLCLLVPFGAVTDRMKRVSLKDAQTCRRLFREDSFERPVCAARVQQITAMPMHG